MPSAWTYATLEASIRGHIEDQGTDIDTPVDNMIKLGEDRICKDLPLTIWDARDQDVAIAQGSQTANKPSGAIATRELVYTSAAVRYVLLPRTYSFCKAYCPDLTERAPKFFAEDYSESAYFITPVPNLTVTAKADVTKRPASIVSAGTTFIGTNAGDLLLAACMIHAERFILGWEEADKWEAEYNTLLASARMDFRHLLRRDFANMAPQPRAEGKGER